jgi:ABC-2 type transport system ATP-binding protein
MTLQGAGAELAIASSALTKRFRGGQVAVDHVDLAVPRGAVYGFLGPNGSGKTTTIRMLLGLAFPTSGSAAVLGVPMPEGTTSVLSRVGSLVEGPAFYPYLSGWDNLARYDAADRTASAGTAKARIGTALERVGLTAAARKKFRNYSLGMKQRLAIAAALLTPRDLIILDEPTNGLDPQGTREVRALVRQIAAEGITVFVSSHLLAEVEQVSTHVGVMRLGQLVFQGELAELRRTATPRIAVRTGDAAAAAEVLAKLGLAAPVLTDDLVTAELGDVAPEKITAELVHAGVGVRGLAVEAPSLEDLFVGLTGEGFDVERLSPGGTTPRCPGLRAPWPRPPFYRARKPGQKLRGVSNDDRRRHRARDGCPSWDGGARSGYSSLFR